MSDKVLKALADPTRRRILKLLNEGDLTAGQIADQFEVTAPTVSHHFNVLKDAELVSATRNGTQITYSLNTTAFQDLLTLLMDVFGPERKGQEET
ncbi:MAG: winged helix-turn-helix transcriptional regulator [Armatimonadetes bacterium]|nr:winged helix-turn-helix transcriptional regulator [Armatimonadota bacterium]